MLTLFHRISQCPDGVDVDLYHIAFFEEFRRSEAHAYALRGAGRDDVAREEGHAVGEGRDKLRDGEDEVGGGAFLTQAAIDFRVDGEGERPVTDHDGRTHRAEDVEVLAAEPLEVLLLEVSGGDVIDDGVAIDVLHRIFFRDVRASFADDDTELAFVVDFLGDCGMAVDLLVRPDDGGGGFGEEDWIFRVLGIHVLVKFLDVCLIVLAHAEDISSGIEGGFETDARERDRSDGFVLSIHFERVSQVQEAFFAAFDEIAQRLSEGDEVGFFQIDGGVDGGGVCGEDAPLAFAFVVVPPLSVKFYSVGEIFPKTIKEESPPLSGNVIISVRKNKTKKGPSSWTL